MTEIEKAKDLTKRLKGELRKVLNKHCLEANTISKTTDPHTPIVGAMQVALISAACEYLVACGMVPGEALEMAYNVSGVAMEQWLNAVLKQNNLIAKTNLKTLDVNNDPVTTN